MAATQEQAPKRRRKSAAAVTQERLLAELAQVAFAPLGDAEEGGVKAADKLRALEMLAKQIGVCEEVSARNDPFAGLTTGELRRLAAQISVAEKEGLQNGQGDDRKSGGD